MQCPSRGENDGVSIPLLGRSAPRPGESAAASACGARGAGRLLRCRLPSLCVFLLADRKTGGSSISWTIENYTRFFTEAAYWRMLLRSFGLVSLASALTVLLSFPVRLFRGREGASGAAALWILIAIIPFWTSYLIRVLAWLNMFGDQGLINQALIGIGLTDSAD